MNDDARRNELTLVQKVRDYFLSAGEDFYEQKSRRRHLVWGLQALVPELRTSKEVELFAKQCNSFLRNLLIYVNYNVIADSPKGKFAKQISSFAREYYLRQVLHRLETALNQVYTVPGIYKAIAGLINE